MRRERSLATEGYGHELGLADLMLLQRVREHEVAVVAEARKVPMKPPRLHGQLGITLLHSWFLQLLAVNPNPL